uniref:Uncharacterized protein n=1 Tax=Myoviridae sp. ctVKV3 TaxID=2827688 RepID=A0A8S5SBC8_9CAUD|nr:MAG TPA: hypothetical protein [Myoviridae sp. ctVKV3]
MRKEKILKKFDLYIDILVILSYHNHIRWS